MVLAAVLLPCPIMGKRMKPFMDVPSLTVNCRFVIPAEVLPMCWHHPADIWSVVMSAIVERVQIVAHVLVASIPSIARVQI